MGGARIDTRCLTNLDGLYVAGEDAGGVHGANRLGATASRILPSSRNCRGLMTNDVIGRELAPSMKRQVEEWVKQMEAPFEREGEDLYPLRETLRLSNWEKLGLSGTKKDCRKACGLSRSWKKE